MKKTKFFLVVIFLIAIICAAVMAKGSLSGKHLVGGSGSSHKGGHYVGGSSSSKSGNIGGSSSSKSGNKSSSGSYSSSSNHSSGYHRQSYSSSFSINRVHYNHVSATAGVERDLHGRIKRSESAKEEFLRGRGYTKVPPGYEVDHIIPLYAGGSDTPGNMQLLSKTQHHAKTKADYRRYGR